MVSSMKNSTTIRKTRKSPQVSAFAEAARAAECDEDEGRFRERLARVVKPEQKPAEKKK
jgi:hypothetical protein